MIGSDPLLNPKPSLSQRAQRAIDLLSWGLPAIAALCSIGSGATAISGQNTWAAALGIAGGVAGASGIFFTNWASRIRDDLLAEARSLGSLGMSMANAALERMPPDF